MQTIAKNLHTFLLITISFFTINYLQSMQQEALLRNELSTLEKKLFDLQTALNTSIIPSTPKKQPIHLVTPGALNFENIPYYVSGAGSLPSFTNTFIKNIEDELIISFKKTSNIEEIGSSNIGFYFSSLITSRFTNLIKGTVTKLQQARASQPNNIILIMFTGEKKSLIKKYEDSKEAEELTKTHIYPFIFQSSKENIFDRDFNKKKLIKVIESLELLGT